MTWKYNTSAGWAWLLFAGVSVIIGCIHDLPKLAAGLILDPGWGLVVPLVNVLSLVGLCQFAVRWRSPRTTRFWRGFALLEDAPIRLLGVLLALGLVIVPTVFTAVAMLRLGDYLGPTRRPLGQKPAQLSLSLS